MADLDYTKLPRIMFDIFDAAACPLSSHQQTVLMGAMASIQMQIEMNGLKGVIDGISAYNASKEEE